ncbi:MAG: Proton/glutamate-aspartate symporter [Pseudomonadales bacterium]|nr:Proton/glutamate-aspartate symporter [Pseudomonadales bacterium]
MKKLALHWQILIAIVLAALAGSLSGTDAGIGALRLHAVYEFLGTIFIKALKMIIVPLIFSSIVVGITGIGRAGDLGRLGAKTIAIYLGTGLLAVLIGLVCVNVVRPGFADGEPVGEQLALHAGTAEVAASLQAHGGIGELVGIFERMVPENVVATASNNGDILALIVFALLFGFFIARAGDEHAEPLFAFWNAVFHVMMGITEFVMRFAPLGVFGLVAAVVAETGFDAVRPLTVFALTVTAALALHAFLVMPLMIRVLAGVAPQRLYRAMSPALLTAFSTASSSGTLPVTIECMERDAGISNRISSFVLPLGATVNMNGTALYECVAVIFLAQAYGVELSFATQALIVITALLTSIGVAGIPSASLVAIGMILTMVGIPIEALGVLFVFDRILDMLRTSVNVLGDGAAALIVARLQGERTALADAPLGERRHR